jgi:type II secretory pathway component PulF
MVTDRNQKRDMMIAFGKLGEMLRSGVPFLQAVDTVRQECADPDVAKAFATIHDRVGRREEVKDVLSEFGDLFPASLQLMWKAGQCGGPGHDPVPECCRRAAAIIDLELRHQ